MRIATLAITLSASLILTGSAHFAQAAADPNADVVYLRKDCSMPVTDVDVLGYPGTGVLRNCFTDSKELTDWIGITRNPSASSPLLVDIGPGEHGQIACGGNLMFTIDPTRTRRRRPRCGRRAGLGACPPGP